MDAYLKKRNKEKEVVGLMIDLYCRNKHKDISICKDCLALKNYAYQRIDKCPFMETKTFCSNCKVHCYNNEQREKIRKVMRYSGPRMIFYHPILAISHLIASNKDKHRIKDEN